MTKQFDIEFDITEKVQTLVKAKWDAPKIVKDIERMIKRRDKIYAKLGPLHHKADCGKKEKKNK